MAILINQDCATSGGWSKALRLRSTGSWKPFRGPQKLCSDSIKTMRYVIIDNSLMAFAVNACLFALVLA